MPARKRQHGQSGNRRGAAVLLVVYAVALSSLLLANVSLQRSTVELRGAERFRAQHGSFWLAEAALDDALRHLRRPGALTPADPHLPAHTMVLDGVAYQAIFPAPGADRSATFTVTTAPDTVILPAAAPGQPPRERVTRLITVQGREGRGLTTLAVEVNYDGPVLGIRARRAAVANGGKGWQATDTFFSGTMRSRLLSMTTTVSAANVLTMEGLAVGDPALLHADNALALRHQLSTELLSLRAGYKFLNGITQDSNAGLNFVDPGSGLTQTTLPHVTGTVSVASQEQMVVASGYLPQTIDPADCGGTLALEGGKTVIHPGFQQGDVRDLSADPHHIVLCVQAIVPASDEGWLMTLLGMPAELEFNKPATVYLMGRQTFDLNGYYVDGPSGPSLIGLPNFTGDVFQPVWNVALAAKVSAVDAHGKRLNGGLKIQTARLPVAEMQPPASVPGVADASLLATDRSQSGVIWVQPGALQSASIYAPDSLVVLRARNHGDKLGPLVFESLVGDEVVVDLKDDTASFGWSDKQLPAPVADVVQEAWTYGESP